MLKTSLSTNAPTMRAASAATSTRFGRLAQKVVDGTERAGVGGPAR